MHVTWDTGSQSVISLFGDPIQRNPTIRGPGNDLSEVWVVSWMKSLLPHFSLSLEGQQVIPFTFLDQICIMHGVINGLPNVIARRDEHTPDGVASQSCIEYRGSHFGRWFGTVEKLRLEDSYQVRVFDP